MHLHVCKLEHDFTNTVGVTVEFFIWTAYDDLVQQLSDQFVPLLESVVSTLRTAIPDFSHARATERLIALETVMRVRDQVETDGAGESLLEELVLLISEMLMLLR